MNWTARDALACGLHVEHQEILGNRGAGDVTRTRDLLITNQLLYQLSYAGQAGNEHSTTAVRLGSRLSQLRPNLAADQIAQAG